MVVPPTVAAELRREAAKAAAITRWSAQNAAVLVNMLQLLSQAQGKLARNDRWVVMLSLVASSCKSAKSERSGKSRSFGKHCKSGSS